MKYLVGIGGSPRDQREEFTDFDLAFDRCLEMAREMAKDQGFRDPAFIGKWESCRDGEFIEGGACPDGDTGAYWPVVVRVAR